ncbi:MAG: cryptochrome/photolyase family protein [Gammaproteobacteria bacterium]
MPATPLFEDPASDRRPDALVLVLGDQLTPTLPALAACDVARTRLLMCEVATEAGYVPHHRKKLAFIFSAMRHFATELCANGWQVDYVRLDDPGNTGSLRGEIARAAQRHRCRHLRVTRPGEWRVQADIDSWSADPGLHVTQCEDTRFLCPPADFAAWAADRRALRMEYFYREMRRRTGLLMDGDRPVGGRWNFDAENRRRATSDARFIEPPRFAPDAVTAEVLDLVDARFPDHPGQLRPFWFGVTRTDARAALDHFIAHALPGFGATQDAMLRNAKFLNHAVLSHYLNVGLLDPLETCRAAEAAYHAGHAPLAAVEGFIRQIIGWREYVRGIYWREMPGYRARNALGATRALPSFYWTGNTDMACLRAAITQTLEESYAHHIQRLMITGNFALLAGVDPQALHEWYLAVYADAYEWVELPNTLGMSQYADGGLLASKPYAASGAYIRRMSDYCDGCRYRVTERIGDRACPFNALYWDFIARHSAYFARHPRMGHAVRTWQRFVPDVQRALRARAAAVLAEPPSLENR